MKRQTCHSTLMAVPPCTAWIDKGHDWHGCKHLEGHKTPRRHECKCGETWTSSRRRPRAE